ncbi:MAG: aldose 1-epimerase [Geminicoccaceae bacterium]
MTRDKVVALEHGDYVLELCPEGGGCMTAFRYQGIDVMRPATDVYWQNYEPRAAASFPLVPFSNRIADGRALFEGETYQFPINMPPDLHSIHGDGWKAAWQLESAEPARAVLVHRPEDTPFPYMSRQIFELSDGGLSAALEITNTGDRRVPVGFGHHPYFPRTEGLTLEMAVTDVWLPDERQLPVSKIPVPDRWNFTSAKALAPLDLDHDFTGGDGKAVMRWQESGIRLAIDADPIFAHVVVYVPPGRDFVCVEPVSHLANAVNLAAAGRRDTGLQVLEPGATLSGAMRFGVTL